MPRKDLVPIKDQVYLDDRPPSYFDRFHTRARTRESPWLYTFARIVSYPYCRLAFKVRAEGLDLVPPDGPVILAANHFSGMDHWFVGILLPRRVRWMAKSQLFRGPFLEWFLPHIGAFPVRRGQRDEESITTALTILERGGVLVIYPEGGRSRTGKLGTSARPGVGRLALQSGAPVVPVAIIGSDRARNWRRLEFPAVTVRYRMPMRFGIDRDATAERRQEVADEVLAAIRDLYARPIS